MSTKQRKTDKAARRSVQRMVVPLTPARLYGVAVRAYGQHGGMWAETPFRKLNTPAKAGWRALAEYLARHNAEASHADQETKR